MRRRPGPGMTSVITARPTRPPSLWCVCYMLCISQNRRMSSLPASSATHTVATAAAITNRVFTGPTSFA